jgi:hypothetical protein
MEQWIGSCNRSRCGKMNVLINYNIYNIILSLYGTSDGAMDGAGDKKSKQWMVQLNKTKERWIREQAIDQGAIE